MKLVDIFNPFGYDIQEVSLSAPRNLYVIYQDNQEKYFIKFLDTGDFALLFSKLESVKDEYLREKEVEKFLTQGMSTLGCRHKYKPIKNEFYFKSFPLAEDKDLLYYLAFQDFPKDKLCIESFIEEDSQTYTNAVIFPNKELYVGSPKFIYQNSSSNLETLKKSVMEIQGRIQWLVESLYLEEAKELIYRIKASGVSLDEYKHPNNLVVFDGSDNFLDQQLNRIEILEFIESRTKHLDLKIFKR